MKERSIKFSGFPAEAFRFLRDLERNNDRQWFLRNRSEFESCVLEPAQAFVAAFGATAQRAYPDLVFDTRTNGSGSMFRISRDTRFARDKSPYKTNVGMRFWLSPAERQAGRVRLYVHVDRNGVCVYGGVHGELEGGELQRFRAAVAGTAGARLRKVLDGLAARGFEIHQRQLARVPAGFSKEHVNADLLRNKSVFACSPAWAPAEAGGVEIVEICYQAARALKPLNDWIGEAL